MHVQFSSVTQLCQNLCDSMDYSIKRFPIHHQLLELAQTDVQPVSDAIQPSHPLLSPSPPALIFPSIRIFNNNHILTSCGQSIGASASASVLSVNIQGWFPLGLTGLISLHAQGLSRVFSNTIVQKHQLFGAQLSVWSNSHIHTWLLEKPKLWLDGPLLAK